MRKTTLFIVLTLTIFLLCACNRPEEAAVIEEAAALIEEATELTLTAAIQTVYAQFTETARVAALSATPTFTTTPTNTFTPLPPTSTPTTTLTQTPTSSPTEAPTLTPTSGLPCNRANLETKSIPDGGTVHINTFFTQTFRLKNTGSCTWDQNYELRFVEGDLLNAAASITMIPVGEVQTWGYANVDVLMKAPSKPGVYKGYWIIKAANGQLFGVGPSGVSTFFVEVNVIDPDPD